MLNCGHDSAAFGYIDGYTMCHRCMYIDQVAQMSWATKLFAYHGENGLVTDWPGNRLGNITREKITKTGKISQLRVWVTDLYGQRWYGTGPTESGTYLRLRKVRPS